MQAKLIDVSERDYHADNLGLEPDVPTLSASLAHILNEKSPRDAYIAHPKLGGLSKPPTDAMERGTIMHSLVLGTGGDIAVVEANDWRTKAAKAERDDARDGGQIPVLAGKYADYLRTATRIKEQLPEFGIDLSRGDAEQTIVWDEMGVPCRCRIDWLNRTDGVIYDFKTTADANPNAISRSMTDYAYVIQNEAYQRAVGALDPDLAGRTEMLFIFAELEEPFTVTVAKCGGTLREMGRRRWERALRIWTECSGLDRWGRYSDDVVYLEATDWAYAREVERDMEEMD